MKEDEKLLSVRLHGPNVQEADVWRLGQEYCDLFDAVASELSGESMEGMVKMTGVSRMCDGCKVTYPGFALPVGWVSAPNGDDLCPDCQVLS